MKKIAPGAPETKSADLVVANIDRLKELFHEAFTKGKIRPPDLEEFSLLPDWQNHRLPRLSTRAADSCPDR